MKPTPALKLLTVVALLLQLSSQGQNIILQKSILFPSGRSGVRGGDARLLKDLIDSLSVDSSIVISVEGHSDNAGKYRKNKLLSRKRAEAVKKFLLEQGIAVSAITLGSWGPDRPIADNGTKEGRRRNRRVDLVFFRLIVPVAKEVPGIDELYRLLESPVETFCIDNTRDTVIRCSKGTVLYIKAHSFIERSNCDDHCIRFRVREDLLRSDMILDDLSTTSNGEMLESRGMIYTEAVDCNGDKMALQNGKDLVILMPVDSIMPGAAVFDGSRGHDSIMNWTVNNNSLLASFTLPELDLCGSRICGRGKKTIGCQPCKFFFCRIGRVGKAIGGIASKEQRSANMAFRQCQKDLKRRGDTIPDIIPSLLPKCRQLQDLFKQYGVTDMEGLIKAINRTLLDSFKVTTMEQLEDTLRKVNTKRIELAYTDRKISFDDFKYYVYNTNRLGWSNVDCFSFLSKSRLTTVSVNLEPAKNVACKLVFRARRVVMPATKADGKYVFAGVPTGERATIVAIKYEDGKPYLATKEITISSESVDVDFRLLTLDELKSELRKLDD